MKHALFCLVILFCFSCKKDSISHQSEFDASLKIWSAYKTTVNNAYTFTLTTASFTGNSTETTITVQNGVVTGRVFKRYAQNGGTISIVKTWTENAATLNTHTDIPASVTIDDLYNKAKNEWLTVDKSQNQIYFETANNGIISNCGYVPKGCQDDCFVGVNIKSITAL